MNILEKALHFIKKPRLSLYQQMLILRELNHPYRMEIDDNDKSDRIQLTIKDPKISLDVSETSTDCETYYENDYKLVLSKCAILKNPPKNYTNTGLFAKRVFNKLYNKVNTK